MTITLAQAHNLFLDVIKDAENAVRIYVQIPVFQYQYDALVSLVFNIGAGQFQASTLRRLLNIGDIQGAANQFPVWKYHKGVVLDGLVKRRAAEKKLFEGKGI